MVADGWTGPRRFPTTSWSLVALAAGDGPRAQHEALERLLTTYLPALRAHLIHSKRLAPEEADDVLQDFVTTKILERELIARADQHLGRFRSFLLTALERFWLNRLRSQHARKRAAEAGAEALGQHDEIIADASSHADAYTVAWARQVLRETIEQMRTECESSDRTRLWELFKSRVLDPILDGSNPVAYEDLVPRLGFRSAGEAANALVTAKRMFARTLRAVVGQYTNDDDEIDEELADLRRTLAHAPR